MGSFPDPTEWQLDKDVPRPTSNELLDMFIGYVREGHIVAEVRVGDNGPGPRWHVYCAACGERQATADEILSGGVELMTYDDAKWWARGHRTEHGLQWQEWLHVTEL